MPLSWLPLSTAVDRLMSSPGKTSTTGKNSARLFLPFFCLRLHSVSAVQPSFPDHMPKGRWFVCFTALPVQKHFLTSNLNLPQWHIKLLGFYPMQHEHGKQITSFSSSNFLHVRSLCQSPSSFFSSFGRQSLQTVNHSYCPPLDPFQIMDIFLKITGVAKHPLCGISHV